VKNTVTVGGDKKEKNKKDPDIKKKEQIINDAIRALNMSATSVYNLANSGESYRECLGIIKNDKMLDKEFIELFGVTADNVLTILDQRILNEAILDVIVQNSKPKKIDFLF